MKKILLTLLLSLISLSPASSHSVLVSASPSSGSVLVDFPMEVILEFNEGLLLVGQDDPNSVEVFDAEGKLVSGKSKVSGARITAGLSIIGNGGYVVKYRVVSEDGHSIEDEYEFEVQSPVAISAPVEDEANLSTNSSSLPITSALVLALIVGLITLTKKRK